MPCIYTEFPHKKESPDLDFALTKAGLNPANHMLAVTSETSPLAKSDDYLEAFFMDDFIGGRYSSSSAVGGVVLSLAFGPEIFARILNGAAEEDKLAANKNILENPDMLDALIGVYERNVQEYPSTAVLPLDSISHCCKCAGKRLNA